MYVHKVGTKIAGVTSYVNNTAGDAAGEPV